MAKRKGPTWGQIHDDAQGISERAYTVARYSHAHGRSAAVLHCPFCGTCVTAYLWSLCGSGKRCECGAMIGAYRAAYHWTPENTS